MFSALGALIMIMMSYNAGREATKFEIEYRCKEYKTAPLASVRISCQETEKLKWVKKLKR